MNTIVKAFMTGGLAALACAHSALAQEELPDWVKRTDFGGDLRLRWEGVYLQDAEDRTRGRFRTRFGFESEVHDDVKVVLRLATGGGNPVSTNQSFDDGFSLKDIGVDRAYVEWKANDNIRVFGGKMKSPWFRSGGNNLMWDSDLNPEGVAAAFSSGMFFGNLGWMVVEETSANADVFLYSGQAGAKMSVRSEDTVTAGLGYFHYTDVAGQSPFFFPSTLGNSADANGNYLFDFSIFEAFAEYKTRMNGWPLTFFGQFAQNTEVDEEDTAFAFGVNLGSSGQRGQYELSYAYHVTEADAVVASFSDSDFANGFADSKGHLIKAKYALRDRVILGGTFIFSRFGEFAGSERDFDRIMLDIEFKF